MEFKIRNYKSSDLDKLYEICLKTGDSGKDASMIYKDPFLLGHYYAAPYAVIHPELNFILTKNEIPIGYVLGTDNSELYYHKCEELWFPKLRDKYLLPEHNNDSPDSKIIKLIYNGILPKLPKIMLDEYPAHLHIDILPEGQGQGMGKKLIFTFIDKLKELNVPALHLEVGKRNKDAIKFYEKIGFKQIKDYEFSIVYGMKF